jgi:hypothetical protein
MSTRNFRRGIAALMLVVCAAIGTMASAEPSNKWRIIFDHSSDGAGEIVFRISPVGGTPIDVTTQIPKGTGENQAAAMIRDAFRAKPGKDVYNSEVDDGEDVLVKARGSTRDFDLVVVRNTAEGLRISLDKE